MNSTLYTVTLTEESVNTIITALRLEKQRYWGKDPKTVKLLEKADEQMCKAERIRG